MPHALLISVRFHEGRYHGAGLWPPVPARLFQAFVAAAVDRGQVHPKNHRALEWLELLWPPVIGVPPALVGQTYTNYVPNNDLDAVGGDPETMIKRGDKRGPAISFIRTPKRIRPYLFDATAPLLYLWRFDGAASEARRIIAIAERLYPAGPRRRHGLGLGRNTLR